MGTGSILGAFVGAALVVAFVVWSLASVRARTRSWKQLANDLGAEFVPGGLLRGSKVVAQAGHATVTLDTYSVPSGDSSTTYTRIRAPLQNRDGFQFRVFREGLVGKIDKALGMQDLEIGIPEFDDVFVVQANNETKVRALLSNAKIRQRIQGEPSVHIGITKNNELHFEEKGVLSNLAKLKSLFELFFEVLNQLES